MSTAKAPIVVDNVTIAQIEARLFAALKPRAARALQHAADGAANGPRAYYSDAGAAHLPRRRCGALERYLIAEPGQMDRRPSAYTSSGDGGPSGRPQRRQVAQAKALRLVTQAGNDADLAPARIARGQELQRQTDGPEKRGFACEIVGAVGQRRVVAGFGAARQKFQSRGRPVRLVERVLERAPDVLRIKHAHHVTAPARR